MDLEIELVNDAEVTPQYLAERGPRTSSIREATVQDNRRSLDRKPLTKRRPLPEPSRLSPLASRSPHPSGPRPAGHCPSRCQEFELDFLLTDGTKGLCGAPSGRENDDWDDDWINGRPFPAAFSIPPLG